jgi:GTP-binding protein
MNTVRRRLFSSTATAAKKRRRTKKTLFNTLWTFETEQLANSRVPNAGSIFCTEKPGYLGPIPPEEQHDTREVAFVGRSNVGKSTLVGALFQQPDMVRSSKTPGRTRDTLFFALGDRTHLPFPMVLVDLPGYGYARASNKEQEKWESKMETYLSQRSTEQLKRVFVLLDARRDGMTDLDVGMTEFLNDRNVNFQLVLTKCDAVHSKEVERVAVKVMNQAWSFQNCVRELIAVSAKNQRGIRELREASLRSAGYTGSRSLVAS